MYDQEVKVNVVAAGNEIIVRQGDAPRAYDYNGQTYIAQSTDALIQLIQWKGSKDNSVIAYSDDKIQVILDDSIQNRPKDRVEYSYKTSIQYQEWKSVLGNPLNQKELIDFMRRRELSELPVRDQVLAQVQKFKYVTNISGDFSYDDNNNYTFAIKVGDAEGSCTIPNFVLANIEIFNESGFIQELEIEIEIKKPKSEQDKLQFILTCPKLEQYIQKATENEVQKVKTALDGYLIVAGKV